MRDWKGVATRTVTVEELDAVLAEFAGSLVTQDRDMAATFIDPVLGPWAAERG